MFWSPMKFHFAKKQNTDLQGATYHWIFPCQWHNTISDVDFCLSLIISFNVSKVPSMSVASNQAKSYKNIKTINIILVFKSGKKWKLNQN